jgi:hypothetical protein
MNLTLPIDYRGRCARSFSRWREKDRMRVDGRYRRFSTLTPALSRQREREGVAGAWWHETWHSGDQMIRNEQELAVTRDRLAKFERLLETLRTTARAEEWPALSSGYRLEIERMQGEILDYVVSAAPQAPAKETNPA